MKRFPPTRSEHLLHQASAAHYNFLLESIKDHAIFMLDPEGFIATWNAGAENIKGYTYEEVVNKHFSIFYTQEDRERNYPAEVLASVKRDGKFEEQGWRVRKDGSRFWANVLITPIFNEQNQHIGFTKITRDLSERIKNKELMQKNQELYRVNQDLDNFIYAASHDLKAPISNIEGLLTVLLESLSPETLANEHNQRIIGMMQYSINRFKLTISNLTDVVKLQKEYSLPPTTVNLAEVTKEVLLDMKQIIESSNVNTRTEIDCDTSIHYSRNNLRSIIYNLVSNGIKYRSPERPPYVEIRCSEKEDYIVLEVEDNGLGMDAKNKNNIFKMFHRLHDHVDGTGIGLFMVKRIIENAGGTIEVKSNLGEGSVFTVLLRK